MAKPLPLPTIRRPRGSRPHTVAVAPPSSDPFDALDPVEALRLAMDITHAALNDQPLPCDAEADTRTGALKIIRRTLQ